MRWLFLTVFHIGFVECYTKYNPSLVFQWHSTIIRRRIIPSNASGLGSINKARETFWFSEVISEQNSIAQQVNERVGDEIIKFEEFGEVNPKQDK
ncbi:hypothetical protein [Acinetobacter colistiniresistens]|uniref:hypothetical protein n=1 Tax=Acinetobacter colistiniresistens TaxID=280145 RepID=UPI0013A6240A|nr:hypothetical protein [Acinetobacter colistiniresistens]